MLAGLLSALSATAHRLLIAATSLVSEQGSRVCDLVVEAHRLRCPKARARARDRTCVPCSSRQILIHCPSRDILPLILNLASLGFLSLATNRQLVSKCMMSQTPF